MGRSCRWRRSAASSRSCSGDRAMSDGDMVEAVARAPYAAFTMAICAIERDVRLSELTPDELVSIVGAVVAAERERAARIAEAEMAKCNLYVERKLGGEQGI